MTSNRQIAKGNDDKQIIGNDNIVDSSICLLSLQPHVLTESLIYSLLQIVYDVSMDLNRDYPLEIPKPMLEKLRFNNAPRYRMLINDHSEDYARLDSVIKDFPDSERIVLKLRTIFLGVVDEFDEDGNPAVGDGDDQLERMRMQLIETILNDERFDAKSYPIELVEQFCTALIAYGVASCKVLVRPD